MTVRVRHPILLAIVFSPFALAAEPAVAAPRPAAARAPVHAVDEQARIGRLCDQVAASYDSARGGFVDKSGVPSESAVELSLALARDGATGSWKERALVTIDWTRSLMDTMSGGFVTRTPKSTAEGAAFETHTDVNGRRLVLLLSAWKDTGDERYRRDAARVAGFMDRVLLDGRGGFVTAQVGDRELEPAANGVAIRAWLTWGAVDGDPKLRDFSLRSIERVWETSFDPLGVLLRRGSLGEVMQWPQLADQVEMGRALVCAWRMCRRERDLARAVGLGRVLLAKFQDKQSGGFMTQARPGKDGKIKKAPCNPEENASAARFLAELAAATGDVTFHEAGRKTVAAFEKGQAKSGNGAQAAEWALASRALLAPDLPERVAWRVVPEPPPAPRVVIFRQPKSPR